MINLRQHDLHEWQERNFGTKPDDALRCAWGMEEETGELCHFLLKRKQGIREGNGHDCKAEIGDAFADIVIYGIQEMTSQGIDVQNLIYKTKFKYPKKKFNHYKVVNKIIQGVAKINEIVDTEVKDDYRVGKAFRKVFYYGAKLMELEGLDYEKVLSETIAMVLKRDWRKNPTGKHDELPT